MIGGSERFLESRRAVLADSQEAIRKADGITAAQTVQPFTNRRGHGCRHALAGEPCEFPSLSMGFLALDIQAHRWNPIYLVRELFYHNFCAVPASLSARAQPPSYGQDRGV